MRSLLYILSVVLSGCVQSTFSPVDELPYGRATITELITRSPYQEQMGFNFERRENLLYSGVVSDTVCEVVTGSTSQGRTYLWSPGDTLTRQAFRFISENVDSNLAEAEFQRVLSAPDAGYSIAADTVQPGQIWIVQTPIRKFAKILIRAVTVTNDGGLAILHTVVTFDWVYQPNGTRSFIP
jgi:hypothetical protein